MNTVVESDPKKTRAYKLHCRLRDISKKSRIKLKLCFNCDSIVTDAYYDDASYTCLFCKNGKEVIEFTSSAGVLLRTTKKRVLKQSKEFFEILKGKRNEI